MTLTESNFEILLHGDRPQIFSLKGTDGKMHQMPQKGLTLVVFMCNHCPYVIAKLDELNRIAANFKDHLTVIGINSNNNPEYPEDSFPKMQEMVQSGKVKFTYVIDEDQSIAKAFGAKCTPDPFLFNNGKLVFHTRIGDPAGTGPIETPELYEVIVDFLKEGYTLKNQKPSMGCNIKWIQ